jgi:predicted RNA-binding Zn-ribbon protein involved in translation (DUF1610 family)
MRGKDMGIKKIRKTNIYWECPNEGQHEIERNEKIKKGKFGLIESLLAPLSEHNRIHNYCSRCGSRYIKKTARYTETVCSICESIIYSSESYCIRCGQKLYDG